MEVKKQVSNITQLEFWSGAKATYAKVLEYDKGDELFELIESRFDGSATETEINDFVWFEDDYIYEQLGIPCDD